MAIQEINIANEIKLFRSKEILVYIVLQTIHIFESFRSFKRHPDIVLHISSKLFQKHTSSSKLLHKRQPTTKFLVTTHPQSHRKKLQQILLSICLLIETLDVPRVKFDIFMTFKKENKQNLSSLRRAESLAEMLAII